MLVVHRWVGLGASIVLGCAGVSGVLLIWIDRPTLQRFHTHILIGEPGEWLVNTATFLAILLILGGAYLWWRRKIVAISLTKTWWRTLYDLHHSLGILAGAVMLIVALTGFGLMLTEEERDDEAPAATTPEQSETHEMLERLHTARGFMLPLQILWGLGSVAFVVQGASGVVMWWKLRQESARGPLDDPAAQALRR